MVQKAINVAGGDGATVPTGFVREYYVISAAAVTASGVDSLATICSQLIGAGDWQITAFDSFAQGNRPGAGIMAGGADIHDGTSVIADGKLAAPWFLSADPRDTLFCTIHLSARISITSPKTISFRVRNDQVSGGPTGTPQFFSRGYGKLIIERVG